MIFVSLFVFLSSGCAQAPVRSLPAVRPFLETPPPPRAKPPAISPRAVDAAPAAPVYSLDVRRVPVDQLLSAIARDARLDLDLLPGVEGLVTLSAYDRPLDDLLGRICWQAGLRHVLAGSRLSVMPDTPFLRAYRVDYVNLARNMDGAVATSTQIATSPSGVDAQRAHGGGNTSLTKIETRAANHFWESLETNIRTLLKEHERHIRKPECEAFHRRDPAGAAAACAGGEEAAFVMSNRETGVLMVLATGRQHRRVAEFIDLVQEAAWRQVMIEAAIVEVTLSDGYRQGIDWNRLGAPAISVSPRGTNDGSAMTPTLAYLSERLDIRLDWLETFGSVKVLSSPRLAVLNNQTAILKVVEEVVYFLVDASTTNYGGSSDREKVTATTTPQSVSVGLVMALTPQIGRDGEITLSVRPTISSISGFRDDPNPSLGSIPNRVPQIRTREIESVLRLADGEVAILGGLMEDRIDRDTGRLPFLGALPLVGEIFTRRDNSARRTELVIFLRPRLIGHPANARAGGNDFPSVQLFDQGSAAP
jgi:general secretion pathway protein D